MSTTRLDVWRTTLHDALRLAFAYLGDVRVHAVPPDQVVAPCVWLDVPAVAPDARTAGVIATDWPVYLVVDGTERSAVALLDQLVANAWDALDATPGVRVIRSRPTSMDVGGPNLRGVIVDVAASITGRTLCVPEPAPPPLANVS